MHAHTLDDSGAHAHSIVHPDITINGRVLTDDQAYALRFALSRFEERMASCCIGSEQLAWYQARCAELDAIWTAPVGTHTHQVAPSPHSHAGVHCHAMQGHWGWTPGA